MASNKKKKMTRVDREIQTYNSLEIKPIQPKTENQRKVWNAFYANSDNDVFLHGSAGTGKSFICMYLALSQVLSGHPRYKKVIIIRNVVPTRDMGFLPGKSFEKSREYEAPYQSICAELFGRGDAYDILRKKGIIEFTTTSFLRSITFLNAIVIVDESQNLTSHEADTVMTRIGEDVRVMFAGDSKQSDLQVRHKYSETSGLSDFMRIIRQMKSFTIVEFKPADIVRSKKVKDYLLIRESLEERGDIKMLSSGV